ncbi:hypothetical protein SAMN05443247_04250 [Bradyrhizobium erythrophlei]|nr:hypothetical protein SAMN05443247_04250 [Bradyrhizobium erythrophlei]
MLKIAIVVATAAAALTTAPLATLAKAETLKMAQRRRSRGWRGSPAARSFAPNRHLHRRKPSC